MQGKVFLSIVLVPTHTYIEVSNCVSMILCLVMWLVKVKGAGSINETVFFHCNQDNKKGNSTPLLLFYSEIKHTMVLLVSIIIHT